MTDFKLQSSHVARLAHDLAKELDRRGIAEMSCLDGLVSFKPAFLKALEGRQTWVIDGCPMEWGLGVFARIGQVMSLHIKLHDFGFKKYQPVGDDFDMGALVDRVLREAHLVAGEFPAARQV